MKEHSPLFRQVHPTFVQSGRVTSQAFRPTPKDEQKLSVYDGELIDPEAAAKQYVEELGFKTAGVLCILVSECTEQLLKVNPDPTPFQEHVLIDFSGHDRKRIETISKKLRDAAAARGWQYQA